MFLVGQWRVLVRSSVTKGGRESEEIMALTSVWLGHMVMMDGSSAAPALPLFVLLAYFGDSNGRETPSGMVSRKFGPASDYMHGCVLCVHVTSLLGGSGGSQYCL